MKFATQHKDILISDKKLKLHRNKRKVWATQGGTGKATTVFNHEFTHVSEAKAWMERPDFRANK